MTKMTTLQTIRREAAMKNRRGPLATQVYTQNSAYNQLSRANYRNKHGRYPYDHPAPAARKVMVKEVRAPARRKTRIGTFSSASAQKIKKRCPQYWRPAGGEPLVKRGERTKTPRPTFTLGIARIRKEGHEAFEQAVETLMKQHGGERGELLTAEAEEGKETWLDVYFEFQSEEDAEAMKKKIEEQEVEGRKMQLVFA